MHSIALIVNPSAGRGRAGRSLARIRKILQRLQVEATFHFTGAPGQGDELARLAIAGGADLVVAVGGDGTLNEVCNAILESPGKPVTLGLLPVGTGNDFARGVGLTGLDECCQTLLYGEPKPFDVGLLKSPSLPSPRRFLVAAGVGFVAQTALTVNTGIRYLHGAPAYVAGALSTLRSFEPLEMTLQLDDGPVESLCVMLVSVSNVETTGGGMKIAPGASPSDGWFDLCVVSQVSKRTLLGQLPGVFRGSHVRHPAVQMRRARKVRITSTPSTPIWIDGEILGHTPLEISLLESVLSVMAPLKADQLPDLSMSADRSQERQAA